MEHIENKVQGELFGVLSKAKELAETNACQLLLDYGHHLIDEEHLNDKDEIPLYLNTSVEDVGKLSFTNKKRCEYYSWCENEAGSRENQQRVKAKVGRVLNRIFKASYLEERGVTNNDIETFTSQLKSFWNVDESCFSISEDFYKYEYGYYCEDAQHEMGTLGDSCMRHSECAEEGYFEMYESSETQVQFVSYNEGDGITSRALLWNVGGGVKLLDRIYQTYDGDIDKFKMYAKNNGWWYKEKQTYGNKMGWVTPNGDIVKKGFIVPCEDFESLSNFPYLDTFTFGFTTDEGTFLTNCMRHAYKEMGATEFREFTCTSGSYSPKEGREVFTFSENLLEKPYLDIDFQGDWLYFNERNCRWSELLDVGYYNSRNSVGDHVIKRINYKGQDSYFHISELKMCEYDGKYYHKSKEFVSADRGNGNYSEVPESKTCILDGVVRLKNEVIVYCDIHNNNVKEFNPDRQIRMVTDVFGVTRKLIDTTKTNLGRVLNGSPLIEMIHQNFIDGKELECMNYKLALEIGNQQF